jgi:hypothetical protein
VRRQLLLVPVVAMLLITGCGGVLGVGLPECEEVPRRPTVAMILSVQAVPSAEYAPCIDELELGWDDVFFEAESGRAEFTITETIQPFLTVTLTPTCSVLGDGPFDTAYEDIQKWEDVRDRVTDEVRVVLIPTGERPLVRAAAIAREYAGTEVEERLIDFTVDIDLGLDVRDRVSRALFDADFVWIIDELGAVENVVEVRAPSAQVTRGSTPDDAIDQMGRYVREPVYDATWYYTFVGGCITYEFSAEGRVAETIEDDVEQAVGFYDLDALRDLARRNGVDIEQAPPPGE